MLAPDSNGRMRLKVLIAYSVTSSHVQTTMDYLLALKRYTDFDVAYVHVTHDADKF